MVEMNNFLLLTKEQSLFLNEISYHIKGIDFDTLIFNLDINYNLRNLGRIQINLILDYLIANNRINCEFRTNVNYFTEIYKIKNDNSIR